MKSFKFTPSIFVFAFLAALHSCKTDDLVVTKIELIGRNSWKLLKVKVGTTESNTTACQADDTYSFEINGTYSVDQGATKCDPGQDQSIVGKWVFSSDETKVRLLITGISVQEKEILELTSTSMRLKYFSVNDIEETYSH